MDYEPYPVLPRRRSRTRTGVLIVGALVAALAIGGIVYAMWPEEKKPPEPKPKPKPQPKPKPTPNNGGPNNGGANGGNNGANNGANNGGNNGGNSGGNNRGGNNGGNTGEGCQCDFVIYAGHDNDAVVPYNSLTGMTRDECVTACCKDEQCAAVQHRSDGRCLLKAELGDVNPASGSKTLYIKKSAAPGGVLA